MYYRNAQVVFRVGRTGSKTDLPQCMIGRLEPTA